MKYLNLLLLAIAPLVSFANQPNFNGCVDFSGSYTKLEQHPDERDRWGDFIISQNECKSISLQLSSEEGDSITNEITNEPKVTKEGANTYLDKLSWSQNKDKLLWTRAILPNNEAPNSLAVMTVQFVKSENHLLLNVKDMNIDLSDLDEIEKEKFEIKFERR